jgi:hypothetical protein
MRVPAVAALRCLVAAALFIAPALGAPDAAAITVAPATGVHGGDISWPNCPKGMGIPSRRTEGQPMPTKDASFVIVGLTNGPGFHPNPCLADQIAWVREHHRYLAAYAMTTYPHAKKVASYGQDGPYDGSTPAGALRNAAYAEATFNLSTVQSVGMVVPMIWVDVEPYPVSKWTTNHKNNRRVVKAVIRAYTESGYHVGIYTYANGWKNVVGGWRLPELPTWSTIGGGHAAAARRACGHGPSGGNDWLMQWWRHNRDKDLICPAAAEQGSAMFASPA